MTPVSHGKPCAGNPHARFDEGASASEEPRRNALLHIESRVEQWKRKLLDLSLRNPLLNTKDGLFNQIL